MNSRNPCCQGSCQRIAADPSASLERRHTANHFASNVERHRREPLVQCYRMVGSLTDEADAVQETLFRAWRYPDSVKKGAPVRP
jgi:DNA-directed RNA polymerase specialized sigma24 family protein